MRTRSEATHGPSGGGDSVAGLGKSEGPTAGPARRRAPLGGEGPSTPGSSPGPGPSSSRPPRTGSACQNRRRQGSEAGVRPTHCRAPAGRRLFGGLSANFAGAWAAPSLLCARARTAGSRTTRLGWGQKLCPGPHSARPPAFPAGARPGARGEVARFPEACGPWGCWRPSGNAPWGRVFLTGSSALLPSGHVARGSSVRVRTGRRPGPRGRRTAPLLTPPPAPRSLSPASP